MSLTSNSPRKLVKEIISRIFRAALSQTCVLECLSLLNVQIDEDSNQIEQKVPQNAKLSEFLCSLDCFIEHAIASLDLEYSSDNRMVKRSERPRKRRFPCPVFPRDTRNLSQNSSVWEDCLAAEERVQIRRSIRRDIQRMESMPENNFLSDAYVFCCNPNSTALHEIRRRMFFESSAKPDAPSTKENFKPMRGSMAKSLRDRFKIRSTVSSMNRMIHQAEEEKKIHEHDVDASAQEKKSDAISIKSQMEALGVKPVLTRLLRYSYSLGLSKSLDSNLSLNQDFICKTSIELLPETLVQSFEKQLLKDLSQRAQELLRDPGVIDESRFPHVQQIIRKMETQDK